MHQPPQPHRFILLGTLALWIGSNFGCANLERNLQDPAIWDKVAAISARTQRNVDRYERQKAQDAREAAERKRQRALPKDLWIDGRWSFTTGASHGFGTVSFKSAVNQITRVKGGILAKRVDARGRGDFYAEVSPNVFRSGAGHVYRFSNRERGVWVDAGGGKTLKLYRKR